MGFDNSVPKVVQIAYVNKTKREDACLFALDNTGQIWFARNPLEKGFKWHCLTLPHQLTPDDEELVGDPSEVVPA